MTITTGTFLSYSAIGNREDLSNFIYNISPTANPFQAAVGTGPKPKATLHEWQTDALATPQANAQLEGDDIASFTAVTATARLFNRTQISRQTTIISGTQDTGVDKAGRKSEMLYQLMKMGKQLRNDIEFVLTNNQTPTTGDSTTAQLLRPLCSWYTTNDSRGAGGADGSTTAGATDGTQRALTESLLKTVLQNCWTEGGEPSMLLCGAFNKGVISGFTGNNTRTQDTSDGVLHASIDVYDGDFSRVKVVPSRISRARDLHVLDTSMWAVAWLRKPQTIDLAKTGDAEKGAILAEYTLVARNQKSSGIVADLTTS